MAEGKMNKIAVATLFLSLLIACLLASANAQPALPTIYIRPDGTIDPPTAPIRRDGDVYTFTGDAFARVYIQRGNIVIDGAGYTLRGSYNGTVTDIWIIGQGPNQPANGTLVPYVIGLDLGGDYVSGLTVKNLNIKNFSIGMYIWTENNTVTGNAVSENIVGILLSGSENAITRNYIGKNGMGIFFGVNQPGEIPLTLEISHNTFDNNTKHLSGCLCKEYNTTEPKHTWDDGSEGNYWSDYNGTDDNNDGIGDAPYVVDSLNLDRYPLMQSPFTLPTVAQTIPVEVTILVLAITVIAIAAAVAVRKRRKTDRSSTENQDNFR
jgi:parallel beta-helix repeat protein